MDRTTPPPQPPQTLPTHPTADPASLFLHRSGAVARMLQMPVSTLRVWERRYAVTQSGLSPGGHRLYSADDVRRLALIKQLTTLGHAIGSVAALDMAQLRRVATTHATAQATSLATPHAQTQSATQRARRSDKGGELPARVWRLAVIGAVLGTRLHRPTLWRRLGWTVQLLGPFDDVAQAATALQGSEVDALLVHEPHLHDGWSASVDKAAPGLARVPKAVLYSFASDAVCEALAGAGTTLLREPQPDAVLAQWLQGLCRATTTQATPATPTASTSPTAAPTGNPLHAAADETAWSTDTVPPRRWGDAALADFASRSSTIACECPRHVAELLMQLSHFEAYSAECEDRSAADADLHAYLRQVAAASRTRFESALEQVALREGLVLPAVSPPPGGTGRP